MIDTFWTSEETTRQAERFELSVRHAATDIRFLAEWVRANSTPRVGIFGSARSTDKAPAIHLKWGGLADRIGKRLAEEGYSLVTGGCPGMPERVEKMFRQHRTCERWQPIVGIRIILQKDGKLAEPDSATPDVMFRTHHFPGRVWLMEWTANAGIFLPGGVGTIYELATFIQHHQLKDWMMDHAGTMPGGPAFLVGREFWEPQLAQLEAMIQQWGTLSLGELDIVVVDSEEEIISHLNARHKAEIIEKLAA